MKKRINIPTLIICIISLILYFLTLLFRKIPLNTYINENTHILRTPFLDKLMSYISFISAPLLISLIVLIIVAYFFYKKDYFKLLFTILTFYVGLLILHIDKAIIANSRPENALISSFGFSFPSGHVAGAVLISGLLVYFYKDEIKNIYLKILTITILTLLPFIIAFNRIYLQVHWLTDIIGALFLAIFWFTLILLFQDRIKHVINKKIKVKIK
ncbi:phosphatase PAP2 family protein [Nanoarchaeota archaeon]